MGKYPAYQTFYLLHIISRSGSDYSVVIFRSIWKLHHWSGSEVCNEFAFCLCIAAVFFCDLFVGRAICTFLGNIVTLGAVIALYQHIRDVGIAGLGRSATKKCSSKEYYLLSTTHDFTSKKKSQNDPVEEVSSVQSKGIKIHLAVVPIFSL